MLDEDELVDTLREFGRAGLELGEALESGDSLRTIARKMHKAWRQSSAFQDARESFRGVVENQMACCLADAAVDLEKAATMTDDELLEVPRMGKVTLANLRRFFAERQQCEGAQHDDRLGAGTV